jgi:hypothetical protein
MGKYGETAVKAVQLVHTRQTQSPDKAWQIAAAKVFDEASSSRKKSCPRDAFLGLCSAGLVKGIPSGAYTDSVKNKAYAVEAVELLKTDPNMKQSLLWATVTHGSDIQHNGQMDVVLGLYDNHLLS